ncbi:MAG: GH25 family lysozyme [Myxococcota bacterium]
MSRRWWGAGFAVLALAAAGIAATAVDRGWVHLHDPPLTEFPIQGLDVSHHQGAVDWAAVAGTSRFRFVWIKATEGGDWADPRFAENWRGATAAGLDVGGYHYFTLCTPGRVQADWFLRALPADGALPPAVDLEHLGNCGEPPSREVVRAEVRAFLDAVDAATGRSTVVYTTRRFHRTILGDAVDDHRLWLRDVFLRPSDLDGWPWEVWQYLSRGRVPGIDGFVDQNAFRLDEAQYSSFLRKTP